MTRLMLVIALGLGAAGCGHAFDMSHPSNFVVLDEDDEQYAERATSADGVVIAIRQIDNDNEGNLEFWSQAIRNRLRIVGGYALLSENEARARTGERGKQMRFGRDEGSRPYFYWITLFVTDDHVFVIETGGRREVFERAQPAIERSLARFDID